MDNFLANLHMTMSRGRHGDVFRQICGAGVVAKQNDFNDYGPDSDEYEDDSDDYSSDEGKCLPFFISDHI